MKNKFIAVTVIWLFVLVLSILSAGYKVKESFLDIGSLFAVLNVLVSALAFVAFYKGLLNQSEELKLQREELKLTREELSRSAQAQEESQKLFQKQAETMKETAEINLLVNLLKYYQGIVADKTYSVQSRAASELEHRNIRQILHKIYQINAETLSAKYDVNIKS